VKFLVDMPLSPELAQWLRAEGHEAVHANELSMNRSPILEILQAAARDDCVVITAYLVFPRLLAKQGFAKSAVNKMNWSSLAASAVVVAIASTNTGRVSRRPIGCS
jgi:uncharacterized protein with PIN domain